MGADYFVRMGSTHAICQDYAIAGELGERPYALVSDGCSGVSLPEQPGSPYTDFGARFLVRAAQQKIGQISEGDFPSDEIINRAAEWARHAELPDTSLDATLLVAATSETGDVLTFQTGDGVVASKSRDGTLFYQALSFGNGMPFYLSYLLDRRRLERLLHPDAFESGRAMNAEAAGTVTVTDNIYVPGKGWQTPWTHVEPFAKDSRNTTRFRRDIFYREQHEVVLLLSDGVESFQKKDGTPVPLEEVLERLFDFKGFNGQFLVRRCSRFLHKFCVENGWQHADDFSAAGIHLASP